MSGRVSAEGVSYDAETGTLTIETEGEGLGDLSIALLLHPDSITALMASRVAGGRVEDGFRGLRRIVVNRPGGGYTPVEGEQKS